MSEVPLYRDPRLPTALRQDRRPYGPTEGATDGIAPPLRVARGKWTTFGVRAKRCGLGRDGVLGGRVVGREGWDLWIIDPHVASRLSRPTVGPVGGQI